MVWDVMVSRWCSIFSHIRICFAAVMNRLALVLETSSGTVKLARKQPELGLRRLT